MKPKVMTAVLPRRGYWGRKLRQRAPRYTIAIARQSKNRVIIPTQHQPPTCRQRPPELTCTLAQPSVPSISLLRHCTTLAPFHSIPSPNSVTHPHPHTPPKRANPHYHHVQPSLPKRVPHARQNLTSSQLHTFHPTAHRIHIPHPQPHQTRTTSHTHPQFHTYTTHRNTTSTFHIPPTMWTPPRPSPSQKTEHLLKCSTHLIGHPARARAIAAAERRARQRAEKASWAVRVVLWSADDAKRQGNQKGNKLGGRRKGWKGRERERVVRRWLVRRAKRGRD